MKICKSCGISQPLGAFYKHPGMKDGHLNFCKVCKKIYQSNHQKHKIRTDETWREKERIRCKKKYHKARSENKSWTINRQYTIKRRANTVISNAIRDGRIIPAEQCDECAHDFSIYRREAHHTDYNQPFVVQWLCSLCHGTKHSI